MHILFSAHGGRGGGGRSEPVKLRVVFERLPGDSLHRVQRSPGHLSLLRKQVLLLAGHHRPGGTVLPASLPDHQEEQPKVQGQQVPGLQEEHVENLPDGDKNTNTVWRI